MLPPGQGSAGARLRGGGLGLLLRAARPAGPGRRTGRSGPNARPGPPRDLGGLLSRLCVERERGCALASEEAEMGLTSLGDPLRDQAGELRAVVNVSGPIARLVARVDDFVHRLRAVAANIEALPARPHSG
ncbi:IclR family transcriptional regulator C-terminal domain-containing protein [Streptomyces sp. NBC_00626]|uniref:IclR family transcriptional regulator domain-containing protein n=1 Tax=unclassified Streptomyces TaxID=2593676 RepID=UPI002E272C49